MKAFLMYLNRNFDVQEKLPANSSALIQDLELGTLFSAMASGDKFLLEVAKRAVLLSLRDVETIRYRQNILRDCMANPDVIRQIYDLAVEALEGERKHWWAGSGSSPGVILYRNIEALQSFAAVLRRLRAIADSNAPKFESEGFRQFFATLAHELSDEYFASIQAHLKRLKFGTGVLISVELGQGLKGQNYVLRKPSDEELNWLNQILSSPIFSKHRRAYTFYIAERDEAGARALSELRDRGINLVANALARSNDHIKSFFTLLQTELAFYIGCLHLHGRLAAKGQSLCFPTPETAGVRNFSVKGLYDACLALTMQGKATGSDVTASGKNLVMITGANQGGKSTFLRSVGLGQVMMQCGMFVAAESFRSEIANGIFTHFKREEDNTMSSGKLDEELARMSDIADAIGPNAVLLFNESFASTNEREGSEIGRQIVRALLEQHIKIVFVTHLFDLAHSFYQQGREDTLFLRAERLVDGRRTFRMVEGEPLDTSYGQDLYRKIFGSAQPPRTFAYSGGEQVGERGAGG